MKIGNNCRMKSSVNKTSFNMFLWALMPIILFSLVAVAIPYFTEKTDSQITSDKDTDWITLILHNEIEMHKADSVSLPLDYGKLLHQGSVKHLFPDLKCKDLSLSHGNGKHEIFLIIYTNSSIPIIVDSLYYKNGEWIGFNMQNGKEVSLGKMIGSPNLNETIMDVPATYINVYSILTLGIMLICLCLLLWEWLIPNDFGKFLFLLYLCFAILCIGLLIDNFREIRIASPYMPETVITLFIISEMAVILTVFNSFYAKNQIESQNEQGE